MVNPMEELKPIGLKPTQAELITVGVRFKYTTTDKQKRVILNEYPSLRDLGLERVKNLILVDESVRRKIPLPALRRKKKLYAMFRQGAWMRH